MKNLFSVLFLVGFLFTASASNSYPSLDDDVGIECADFVSQDIAITMDVMAFESPSVDFGLGETPAILSTLTSIDVASVIDYATINREGYVKPPDLNNLAQNILLTNYQNMLFRNIHDYCSINYINDLGGGYVLLFSTNVA